MTGYYLAIRSHRLSPGEAPSQRVCSILLDLVEDVDWRTAQENSLPEPDVFVVAPDFLDSYCSVVAEAGFTVLLRVPGSDKLVRANSGQKIRNLLSGVPIPVESGGIHLWICAPELVAFAHRTEQASELGEGCDEFLFAGGMRVEIERSCVTAFLECRNVSRAEGWFREAASELGIRVEQWEV